MRFARLATSIVALVSFAACGAPGDPGAPATSGSRSEVVTSSPTVTPTPQTASSLQESFARLRDGREDDLVIAWAPVGSPEKVQVLGDTDTIDAWSTIKVPIALATVQQQGGQVPESVESDLKVMLRESDNDAARRLWNGLAQYGDPAEIVEDTIEDSGDVDTQVSRDVDGERVAFGLTDWSVADSARFAAMLPCRPHSDEVLNHMGNVMSEQSWGVGALDNDSPYGTSGTPTTPSPGGTSGLVVTDTAFKGGWGPSPEGYLMRQIGVVRTADGSGVGVALLTQPEGEDHERGARTLSDAAVWLSRSLSSADTGSCAGPATS